MDNRLLDLNRYGVLNPPASFYWAVAFLLRHWLLLLVVGASSLTGVGGQWTYGALSWQVLAAGLPTLVLVYAWTRRIPTAGGGPRRIWSRGALLLALTAVLNIAWAAWTLSGRPYWQPWPDRMIALLALVDAFIAVGCWRSPLYRALFADFPARPAPG